MSPFADGLSNGLGSLTTGAIQALQTSLTNVARATGDAQLNPRIITGVANLDTLRATYRLLETYGSKDPALADLRKKLSYTLSVALVQPTLIPQAQQAVAQYAQYLTSAIQNLIAKAGAASPAAPLAVVSAATTLTKGIQPRPDSQLVHPAAGLMPTAPAQTVTQSAPASGAPTGTAATLPTGSISTLLPSGMWRNAVPRAAAKALQGLGYALGADGDFTEVSQTATQPAGSTAVSNTDFDKAVKKPWYKNWKVVVPVGVAGTAVGLGAIWMLRRGRRHRR